MLHKFLAPPSLLYTSVVLAERVLRVFNFASDIDARKSVTGYLMFLNGGPVSWKASRQGRVTLSSSCEAKFVDASQVDKKYFTFGRSLKDLPTYSMVLQRSGKITRLASS